MLKGAEEKQKKAAEEAERQKKEAEEAEERKKQEAEQAAEAAQHQPLLDELAEAVKEVRMLAGDEERGEEMKQAQLRVAVALKAATAAGISEERIVAASTVSEAPPPEERVKEAVPTEEG